jgi:predicted DNA-binding protein (MmcQ/YjbR family)
MSVSEAIDADVSDWLSRSFRSLVGQTVPMGSDAAFVESVEAFGRSLPEAWPDNPWGDRVVKVGKKIFLFVSGPESDRPVITVKVPESHDHALSFPEAFPTRYGLGKHGWVTILVDTVPDEERDVLIDFVEESYRAVATKTLAKRLDAEIAAQNSNVQPDENPTI